MSNPTMIVRSTTKRSGARMTLSGFSLSGEPVKVGVDLIEAPADGRDYWRATDRKTGQVFRLG